MANSSLFVAVCGLRRGRACCLLLQVQVGGLLDVRACVRASNCETGKPICLIDHHDNSQVFRVRDPKARGRKREH